MSSLRELQLGFVAALQGPRHALPAGLAVYRNTVAANYRNALGATFDVARQLVGTPFFNAAADAYVLAHPSTSGDLNEYGDRFGDFLERYAPAAALPYLADVARLEWAIDAAGRAPEGGGTAQSVIAALAACDPRRLGEARFTLHPSCHWIESRHPALRIWRMHQGGFVGDDSLDLSARGEWYLVHREPDGRVVAQPITAGEFAWLGALAAGAAFGPARDAAVSADVTFDLAGVLRARIADRTILAVESINPHPTGA